MSRMLILKAFSDNEYCDADCSFGHVELTQQYFGRIKRLAEIVGGLKTELSEMHEAAFWDPSCRFFRWFDGIEDLTDLQSGQVFETAIDQGHIAVNDGKIPEDAFQRTECNRLIVSPQSGGEVCVLWRAIPKRCDFYVETAQLCLKELEGALP